MDRVRIFVSHSQVDDSFGQALVGDLRRALGGDDDVVWYDHAGGLHAGESWWQRIVAELTARQLFLVILSPDAMASKWVNDEIDLAYRLKNSPQGKIILPVYYRPCNVRVDLTGFQYVSFLPPRQYTDALRELLDALARYGARPPAPPPAPPAPAPVVQYPAAQPAAAPQAAQHPGPPAPAAPQSQMATTPADELVLRGKALKQQGQLAQAADAFQRATQLDPRNAAAWSGIGGVRLDEKNWHEALSAFEMALTLNPKDRDAWNDKGVALDNLGSRQSALEAYERALALDPSFVLGWRNKAQVLAALGNKLGVVDARDHVLKLTPDDIEAWGEKAEALGSAGRTNEALAVMDEAIKHGFPAKETAFLWYAKAAILIPTNRAQEALVCAEQALALDPLNGDFWYARAVILQLLKRNTEALAAIERCITLNPEDPVDAWDRKAGILLDMARYADAIAAIDRAISLAPKNATAQIAALLEGKATVLDKRMGRKNDARAVRQQAQRVRGGR